MRRALTFNSTTSPQTFAFTLVEVVMALGILAVTVVAVLALQGAVSRSAAEISGQERAAQLVDASMVELARLRDRPVTPGQPGRLDALASLIPATGSAHPWQLVATRDGVRVISESDADDPAAGIPLRDRFYVIEVRQQPPPLNYVHDAGYLAVELTIRWPYQIPAGGGPDSAMAADPAQGSSVRFETALTP
jgi:type II secretory pathway pseudopilin PulG